MLVGIVLAGSVLWLAGEEHRKNCQSAGHTDCSVLPWDAGKRIADTPDAREKHMTRSACELLNARLVANGTPKADLYDCSLSPAHLQRRPTAAKRSRTSTTTEMAAATPATIVNSAAAICAHSGAVKAKISGTSARYRSLRGDQPIRFAYVPSTGA